MLEVNDVLSPEFFELAAKAKAIADAKAKEVALFTDLYKRHRAKVAEFDKQVQDLVTAYKNQKTDQPEAADDAKG